MHSRLNGKMRINIEQDLYQKLSDEERLVLSMIENFAPSQDSTAWPCDYDEMLDMAAVEPKIDDGAFIPTISRFVEMRIIDSAFSLDGEKLEIWVSPWKHRAQLRFKLSSVLIERRTGSTQAA